MINSSEIKNLIQDIFSNNPYNVNSIGLGYKVTNNIQTDQLSLIFGVDEKKSLSEIPSNQIIPASLNISTNTDLPTDVIPMGVSTFLSNCFAANDSSSNSHRIKHRPLVGGISIGYPQGEIYVGTLGRIFRDKDDGSLVCLTNAHVGLGDLNRAFINTQKPVSASTFNIQNRYLLQTDESTININDKIGYVKRYYPLYNDQLNYIDASLLSIEDGALLSLPGSLDQLGLGITNAFPIATTAEIDNLLSGPILLTKSGRSSGFIGGSPHTGIVSCPIITAQLHYTANIKNVDGTLFTFSDTIAIKYQATTTSTYNGTTYNVPQSNISVPGDSGSIVLGYINNTYKIIALLFAGGSYLPPSSTPYIPNNNGLLCRIDKVCDLLNIEPWDGTNIIVNPASNWNWLTQSGKSNNINIVNNGKKYWQIGLNSSGDDYYVNYDINPTTTPTNTLTQTPSLSLTDTIIPTPTPTSTISATVISTSTPIPTPTPSLTFLLSPTPTPTLSATYAPNPTTSPSSTPTPTPSITASPTITTTAPVPTTPNTTLPPKCDFDIIFLIDVTGSMAPPIEEVKSAVNIIVQKIIEKTNNHYRLGLCVFDEAGQKQIPAYVTKPFYIELPSDQKYVEVGTGTTNNVIYITCLEKLAYQNKDKFISQLLKINTPIFNPIPGEHHKGHNIPEPSDVTVDLVVNGNFAGAFRDDPDIGKIVIVITDAPPAGKDDFYDSKDRKYIDNILIPSCNNKKISVFLMTSAFSNALFDLATATNGFIGGLTSKSIIDGISLKDCVTPQPTPVPTVTISASCCVSDTKVLDLCKVEPSKIQGCTNPHSPNYNPNAECDDGSCITCCNSNKCIVNDKDAGKNCNSIDNGCCDNYCLTAKDCSPTYKNSFMAVRCDGGFINYSSCLDGCIDPTPTATIPVATATQTPTPSYVIPTLTPTIINSTPTPTTIIPTVTPSDVVPTPVPTLSGPTPTGPTPTPEATIAATPTPSYIISTPTPSYIIPTPTPSYVVPTPTPSYIEPTSTIYGPTSTGLTSTPTPSYVIPTPTPSYVAPTPTFDGPSPTPNMISPTLTLTIYAGPTPTPSYVIPTPTPSYVAPTPTNTFVEITPTPTSTSTPMPTGPTPTPTICIFGYSWEKISNNSLSYIATSNDNKYVYLINANQSILKSDNFGYSWKTIYVNKNWSSICSSPDGSVVVATALNDQIFISYNYGETWYQRSIKSNWTSVDCSDDGSIIIACEINGKIYISTDSGLSWTPRTSNKFWKNVCCSSDGKVIFACAFNDRIYKSIDKGVTWISDDNYGYWSSIDCSSNGLILIIGTYKQGLYISRDGGVTLSKTYTSNESYWTKVSCSDDGSIFTAINDDGYIYTSIDNGYSWTSDSQSQEQKNYINNQTLIDAVTTNNGILLSSDNGIFLSSCNRPTPLPSSTPTLTTAACNESIYTIIDPFVENEDTEYSIYPQKPSNAQVSVPDIFTIDISQNKCKINSNIISSICTATNRKFCNIDFGTTTSNLQDLVAKTFTDIEYLELTKNKTINLLDIYCDDFTTYPLFNKINKVILLYQHKNIGHSIMPLVQKNLLNAYISDADTVILHQTSSINSMKQWINTNFKFVELITIELKTEYYNLDIKYKLIKQNDLYWMYLPYIDPYAVYLNIVPS